MKSHYYCGKCDSFFFEEEDKPNMNRIHFKCGSHAKLLKHIIENKSDED